MFDRTSEDFSTGSTCICSTDEPIDEPQDMALAIGLTFMTGLLIGCTLMVLIWWLLRWRKEKSSSQSDGFDKDNPVDHNNAVIMNPIGQNPYIMTSTSADIEDNYEDASSAQSCDDEYVVPTIDRRSQHQMYDVVEKSTDTNGRSTGRQVHGRGMNSFTNVNVGFEYKKTYTLQCLQSNSILCDSLLVYRTITSFFIRSNVVPEQGIYVNSSPGPIDQDTMERIAPNGQPIEDHPYEPMTVIKQPNERDYSKQPDKARSSSVTTEMIYMNTRDVPAANFQSMRSVSVSAENERFSGISNKSNSGGLQTYHEDDDIPHYAAPSPPVKVGSQRK